MFIVVFACEEITRSDITLTHEGDKVVLCKGEWGPTTCIFDHLKELPEDVMTFKTAVAAEKYAKKWIRDGGHPWYYVPKSYEIFSIIPIKKEVITGYKLV